tara:strand:+ start:36 stop:551 length:516 start_codon:yes stop_codon:yes gene_type:complete
MVRQRKYKKMKGGDVDIQEYSLPITESRTTINNRNYTNTLIDNQNSVNNSNLTQIESQKLQKGGAASTGVEGKVEIESSAGSGIISATAGLHRKLMEQSKYDDQVGLVQGNDGKVGQAEQAYGQGGGLRRRRKSRKKKRKSRKFRKSLSKKKRVKRRKSRKKSRRKLRKKK